MPRKTKNTAVDLSHIVDALRPLAVPISGLISDPANARKHPEKNLDAIKASLRVYGQLKPIVVNQKTKVVEAGNGTLEAAKALGWTHLAAVPVEDDPATAAGFAIADNRTAELAEWDNDALAGLLRSLETEDADLAAMLHGLADDVGLAIRDEVPAALARRVMASSGGAGMSSGSVGRRIHSDIDHR
jgi:ParB-like chromosome segregation protein Spo0J